MTIPLRTVFAVVAAAFVIAAGSMKAEEEPQLDPHTVSAEARRVAGEFWAALPSGERAALARELTQLEGRARVHEPFAEELSRLQARYAGLFQPAKDLRSVRWITTSGGSTQAHFCGGVLFIGRNGRARCIGAYRTS